MMDEQLHVTWHCDGCGGWGPVNLKRIADKKGIDYCLVDRTARCHISGCKGRVYFRYAPGPGTPSRRLEALRERQDAQQAADADRQMRAARDAYNAIALRYGRLPLP